MNGHSGQSRQKKCALCANFGRAYPLGGYQTAICETCIVTKQLTAFTTDSLERLLEASRRVLPTQEELPPASEDWEKCIACSKGDNTVGHWIRWCVVPISALRSLTGDDSILSLAEGSRKSAKHLAIASRVVHQFRLLLRESGAMRHQISAPPTPIDTWIHNLVQRVQTELPLDLRMQHIRTQLASAHCSINDSLLSCCDKPPLHISCALAPARACFTREAVEANQTVAVVPLGSEPLQLIQQTIQVGTGISPNVLLSTFQCECGDYHCRIMALQPIGTDEVLSSCLNSDKTTLLVQFDGSCHADTGTGGAGAALLELQREGLTLLKWRAVALPSCPDNIFAEAVSANLATDLLCEEMVHRSYAVDHAYLQGDILPIVKHLAFAGRFRRIDLQPIIQQIRRKQSRFFDHGKWVYRPREANILADYLAGVASRAAQAFPAHISEPTEIAVEAPYQLAMRSGAIVLEERPRGVTILLLTEVPKVSMELVSKFMRQTANQQYRIDLETYLAGTANLTKPRIVEYTASATDCLGRLYGRGPCAQRLPRKVRLLLFGNTHQEVDMVGAFYEIMRRLLRSSHLPHIVDLRAIFMDLLGLVPLNQRFAVVKRHPLIVMNAGASEACAKIEKEYHITCPPALHHLSLQIESATQVLVNHHLPAKRPHYATDTRGAAFRTLEWYEEHIMISYYKELTRRCHITSAIWLHDGLWLPKEIPPHLLYEAERAMLHQLQLDSCDPPLFSLRELATDAQALIQTLNDVNAATNPPPLPRTERKRNIESELLGTRPIRWNTQAPTAGYNTFTERMAKRRRAT